MFWCQGGWLGECWCGFVFIVGSYCIVGVFGVFDLVQCLVGGFVEFVELQGVVGKQGDVDVWCDYQLLFGEFYWFCQFLQQVFGDVVGMLFGI